MILLIGFDLVLSESFFNTIVSIEDFSSNENYSSFTQALATIGLLSLMLGLQVLPDSSYFQQKERNQTPVFLFLMTVRLLRLVQSTRYKLEAFRYERRL